MAKHEAQTLHAKLQQFADGLTPDEQAELRAMQTEPEDVTGMLSPSLEDKVRRAAEELAPEEEAELYRLLAPADEGAATGADDDARGYMKAVYEGPYGWKGRPGTDPELKQPGGGGGGKLPWNSIAGGLIAGCLLFCGPKVDHYPDPNDFDE